MLVISPQVVWPEGPIMIDYKLIDVKSNSFKVNCGKCMENERRLMGLLGINQV